MGIRMDQLLGLPKKALEWLNYYGIVEPLERCPMCGHILSTDFVYETYDHYYGMFDDEYTLKQYKTTLGTAEEYVQAEPWNSGPMFFLGLKLPSGDKLEWTEEEIKESIYI